MSISSDPFSQTQALSFQVLWPRTSSPNQSFPFQNSPIYGSLVMLTVMEPWPCLSSVLRFISLWLERTATHCLRACLQLCSQSTCRRLFLSPSGTVNYLILILSHCRQINNLVTWIGWRRHLLKTWLTFLSLPRMWLVMTNKVGKESVFFLNQRSTSVILSTPLGMVASRAYEGGSQHVNTFG